VLFIMCLDQPGLSVCWVVMLSCYTLGYGGLMNLMLNMLYFYAIYLWLLNTRPYA
jgi:hypothetical protein